MGSQHTVLIPFYLKVLTHPFFLASFAGTRPPGKSHTQPHHPSSFALLQPSTSFKVTLPVLASITFDSLQEAAAAAKEEKNKEEERSRQALEVQSLHAVLA
jgi:hypothetical protein